MKIGTVLASCAVVGLAASTAMAIEVVAPAAQVEADSGKLERDTITQLLRPVSVEFTGHRLADVMDYIQSVTGAELEIFWMDDQNAVGLDPDAEITLRARNASALSLLERVLDQAADQFGEPGSNTWQFSDDGLMEVGPKERLNAHRRVEMYDINDLLFEVPDFANAPQFDLNSAFQNSGGRGGGGGTGRSPFQQNNQQQQQTNRPTREELSEGIVDIITTHVESEQWVDNGGDAATVRFFQGHLLINAPDYVHRGINGYRWWPSRLTTRYSKAEQTGVTLTSDELRKHRRDTELVDPRRPAAPVRGDKAKTDDARKPSDG